MKKGIQPSGMITRRKILSVSMKLFLEKGYEGTTAKEVADMAGIISGSPFFQFGNKEGVLLDLVRQMFDGQFATADALAGKNADPLLVYALETALQLHIAEMSDPLRELYVTAYTLPRTAAYIYENMIDKIEAIFSPYLAGSEKNDFYELEIAAAGVMRGFMARHCDLYFTIERKIMRCVSCCFKLYEVPPERYMPALRQALTVDLAAVARMMVDKTVREAEADVEAALAVPRPERRAKAKDESAADTPEEKEEKEK